MAYKRLIGNSDEVKYLKVLKASCDKLLYLELSKFSGLVICVKANNKARVFLFSYEDFYSDTRCVTSDGRDKEIVTFNGQRHVKYRGKWIVISNLPEIILP